MGRANNSSIDTSDGVKIAMLGQQSKKLEQENFKSKVGENSNPITNSSRKGTLAIIKAKAKIKAKMAKASRKKNKK